MKLSTHRQNFRLLLTVFLSRPYPAELHQAKEPVELEGKDSWAIFLHSTHALTLNCITIEKVGQAEGSVKDLNITGINRTTV